MTEHAHSSTAAPASVAVDNMAEHASPPLWNPIAIGLWSILLTPIFGATLQLLNWKALGDEGNARISRYWLFGFIVYCAALAVVPMLSPASSQIADSTYGVGFLLLVAWNMTAGKAQYLHVLRRFGPSYRRRSWFAPLLIGVAIFAASAQLITMLSAATQDSSAVSAVEQSP